MTPNLVPHPDDKSPLADKAAVKVATHASEGGHWWSKFAELIELVPTADGKGVKKTTLREARKLDLAPGITSVIREAAAPGLIEYFCRQHACAARDIAQAVHETEDEWYAKVKDLAGKKAEVARDVGTDIHAAIQAHFHGEPYDSVYTPHVEGFLAALDRTFPGHQWRSEIAVASPRGYGTKIDLASLNAIGDIKGKDGDQATLDELRTYRDHWMQLGAGRQALVEGRQAASPLHAVASNPDRIGFIAFVSRTHPGACAIKLVEEKLLLRGWHLFERLLSFWSIDRDYRPFSGGF